MVARVIKHSRNAGLLYIVDQHKRDKQKDRHAAITLEMDLMQASIAPGKRGMPGSVKLARRTAVESFVDIPYSEKQIQQREERDTKLTGPLSVDVVDSPDKEFFETDYDLPGERTRLKQIEKDLELLVVARAVRIHHAHDKKTKELENLRL
eukprot:gnl/Spiro4/3571_TR1755_c0_g1_i1.p2 gnl/Spiro4/3571_TR1755_c0_g1~~gnl/Spiro4/3571_TR1755_c0_g1_i1.p2  ORF type:complete len:151 (+),score=35.38 gnl/Spiro4/3571_TR1755_c0_g1_i1:761-1213(+)